MSEVASTRDVARTAGTMEAWLRRRLGATEVSVSGLSVPRAGFSNETIIGRASWVGGAEHEGRRRIDFVLRIEPTSHQLFVAPDALRQAGTMASLAGSVPVPRIWLTEPDGAVLGAPFFVMELVEGRVPGDVPSWHRRGWVAELDPADRERLHRGALDALVDLHRVDASAERFAFLDPGTGGTALARHVEHLATWYDWCRPVLRHGRDVIDAALAMVLDDRPDVGGAGIVWGDARVGNMIFGDDLAVAALLDWEGATLGPPEIDVAWWVLFDEFLCEANGLDRLPGVADRDGTLALYEASAGRPLRDIAYYEVLAGLQLALINSRLADRLVAGGRVPETTAAEYVTRVTALTARALDRLAG